MYAPKSKYKVDISGGNEFQYKSSGEDFQGTYILLSSGKMYAGSKLPGAGITSQQIIPKKKKKKPKTYIIKDKSTYNNRYSELKPKINKEQDEFHPIISTKPCPTEKDYEKGFFYRYFVKRKNSHTQYYEVDEETYKEISTGGSKHDAIIYGAKRLRWELLDGNALVNRNMLRREKRKNGFRFIDNLFSNPGEYHIPSEALNPADDLESSYGKGIPESNPIVKKIQKNLIAELKDRSKRKKENKRIEQYKSLSSKKPFTGGGGSSGGSSGGGGGGY